jgi:bifunctional DNA-binding transcriptional regulator/antitoxin component of YhaV-PrlF toxin-antitoxin module
VLAELSTKSQITLPQPILDKMGLEVGDFLEISERDGGIFMAPIVVPKKHQAEIIEIYCSGNLPKVEPEIESPDKRREILLSLRLN